MDAGTVLFGGFLDLSVQSQLAVLYGLGRLNFKHLLLLHKVKFYERMFLKSVFT